MSQWPHYEVLYYEDRQKWRGICQCFKEIDTYFLPEYVYLFELHGDGQACLFVYYESAERLVVYPFMKRTINNISLFADLPEKLCDIISPYGYTGYLRTHDDIDMNKFYSVFKQYCNENDIVSEFVRFHPLLNNYKYCPEEVKPQEWNKTVIIDLFKDNDSIWKGMHSRRRRKINNALKNGVKFIIDKKYNMLDEFHSIYIKKMNSIKSLNYYLFKKDWFAKLRELLPNNSLLCHCYYQESIISSALYLINGTFINTFLSGSLDEYRHLNANSWLEYNMILWAKNQGLKYYHLGGGLKPDDSLFQYKAGFSPLRGQYYIANVIHHPGHYQTLCERRVAALPGSDQEKDFFPLYRKGTL